MLPNMFNCYEANDDSGFVREYFSLVFVLLNDNFCLVVAGKLLLMLQALKRGHAIDPSNPHFHTCAVRFLKTGMYEN